jgi:hypothetical protein
LPGASAAAHSAVPQAGLAAHEPGTGAAPPSSPRPTALSPRCVALDHGASSGCMVVCDDGLRWSPGSPQRPAAVPSSPGGGGAPGGVGHSSAAAACRAAKFGGVTMALAASGVGLPAALPPHWPPGVRGSPAALPPHCQPARSASAGAVVNTAQVAPDSGGPKQPNAMASASATISLLRRASAWCEVGSSFAKEQSLPLSAQPPPTLDIGRRRTVSSQHLLWQNGSSRTAAAQSVIPQADALYEAMHAFPRFASAPAASCDLPEQIRGEQRATCSIGGASAPAAHGGIPVLSPPSAIAKPAGESAPLVSAAAKGGGSPMKTPFAVRQPTDKATACPGLLTAATLPPENEHRAAASDVSEQEAAAWKTMQGVYGQAMR